MFMKLAVLINFPVPHLGHLLTLLPLYAYISPNIPLFEYFGVNCATQFEVNYTIRNKCFEHKVQIAIFVSLT
jgi:hypothetical protein